MMFGLPSKWVIAGAASMAILTALFGGVTWLRNDAAKDERERAERDALKGRIETIEDAKRRRNDVQELPDDDLFDRLRGRLRGPAATE